MTKYLKLTTYDLRLTTIFILLTSFLIFSCKKKEDTIYIRGTIHDPNQNINIAAARVILQAKLISSGVYSSSFTDIGNTLTASDGNFSFDMKVQHVVEYKMIINKDKYFYSETIINADIWEAGKTYNNSYNIYPEAYIKLNVINAIPYDNNDVIYYTFASNYYDCYGCCSDKYITGSGMNYNSTLLCKAQGARNSTLSWHYNKNGLDKPRDTSFYCKPFDTTFVKIQY